MMKLLCLPAAIALGAMLTAAEPKADGGMFIRVSDRTLNIGAGESVMALVEARPSSRELALNVIFKDTPARNFQLTVPSSASGFRCRGQADDGDNGNASYMLYLNFNCIFTLRSGGFGIGTPEDGAPMRRTWEYIYEIDGTSAYLLQEGLRETPADGAAGFLECTTHRANERPLSPDESGNPIATGPLFPTFELPSTQTQAVDTGCFKISKLAENRYYASGITGLARQSFIADFDPAAGILRLEFFSAGKTVCQMEFNRATQAVKAFFTDSFRGMAFSASVEEEVKGEPRVRVKADCGNGEAEFFFSLDPKSRTFILNRRQVSEQI